MLFMQPEVFKAGYWIVETSVGTEIVPEDVCGGSPKLADLQAYCEGTITQDADIPECEQFPEYRTGWLARMSAPGYLDCTDWSAHETAAAAQAYLADMYGDDEDDDEVAYF